jgi:hypothetical protein
MRNMQARPVAAKVIGATLRAIMAEPEPPANPYIPPETADPAARADSDTAAKRAPKQENALLNLMLNVLAPVVVLSWCSKDPSAAGAKFYHLGPKWALLAAISLPVIYQIWDWIQRRKLNVFSIIGFVSVLLTGGLGLLQMRAPAFAAKEASIPLIFAAIVYFSGRTKKPIVNLILLNPDMVDVNKLERAVHDAGKRPDFLSLLKSSTLILTGSFLISAVLNYVIAYYCINGTEPGTEAYNAAIGQQTLWSALIIIPVTIIILGWVLIRFFKRIKEMTGLDTDQVLLPR